MIFGLLAAMLFTFATLLEVEEDIAFKLCTYSCLGSLKHSRCGGILVCDDSDV